MKVLTVKNINLENNPETKITYFRIQVENLQLSIEDIIKKLTDISWINKFDEGFVKDALEANAKKTANHIADIMKNKRKSKKFVSTRNIGEYLVSELSRRTIVNEMNYLDIPLGEIIKESSLRNPGFDFFSESNDNLIIFGESKYSSKQNSYGSALNQIVRFIGEGKDKSELMSIRDFVSEQAKINNRFEKKGFAAAFSYIKSDDDSIVNSIIKNKSFKKLLNYEEIILVAVEL